MRLDLFNVLWNLDRVISEADKKEITDYVTISSQEYIYET